MNPTVIVRTLVGLWVAVRHPEPRRSERGLSQSAEIAILVGGVAVIALGLITFLGPYVTRHLPK